MSPEAGRDLARRLAAAGWPAERLVSDPLRRLTWGGDASFYRLVPQLIVVITSESELLTLLQHARALHTPLTFRAAGTSLSGQAVTDAVLVMLGDGWQGMQLADDGATIRLQPGVIGAAANRRLAPLGRKIGPDPASIDAAMVGGIAANNASGMCCGTAQNSYHTLASLRVVLADGTVLDTGDPASRAAFLARRPDLAEGLAALARDCRADATLAARIRHKYRMKNTTGYGLNALVDFDDPVDILAHLMIGSEGTLGFLSEITYRTVEEHAHKASALVLFDQLDEACRAVTRLKATPVAAVELLDRASLRAVQHQPGMPPVLTALPAEAAALLIEVRAETPVSLAIKTEAARQALAGATLAAPLAFTTDAAEAAALWAVRKGIFPAVGAVRPLGTTVVIEDVAFPVERLAEAVRDLQRLFIAHGYPDAIVYGHALEGNLHFVFTQGFDDAAEVSRYARFMDAVCRLVVEVYDGALKAEHGTGRNMAPYVALEWGDAAVALMQRIKRLFDPDGLLNPGVILNDDPEVHLKHLKPLPAADPIVDKCIECGFCEPKCPSRGLTLSPRQRIVGWREIQRLERDAPGQASALTRLYDHAGIDTCAACGLCATACPVGIETGLLIKALRGRAAGGMARGVGSAVGRQFGAVTTGVRLGLGAADLLHGVAGTGVMQGTLDGLRRLSGGRVPKWSPALAKPVHFVPPKPRAGAAGRAGAGADRLVYFPSCAARNMGPQRGDEGAEALPVVAQRLFEKAGFAVVYPERLAALCCGQPFESKGLAEAADAKSAELAEVLRAASEDGRWPVVFDTSPCAYRMQRWLARTQPGGPLAVHDSIAFIHGQVLPRVRLARQPGPVAIHPVCSVQKMGLAGTMAALAAACSAEVVTVDAVSCCGFAGDRGFTHPELNAHALRRLKAALPAACTVGYSSSRTCEIGLSEHAVRPYRSIIALVEACAQPLESAA